MKPSELKKEKEAKRKRLSDQIKQWFFKAKAINCTCEGCKKEFGLHLMFRCLYCGFLFCRNCAELHFGDGRYEEKLSYAILQKGDGLVYPEVVHIELKELVALREEHKALNFATEIKEEKLRNALIGFAAEMSKVLAEKEIQGYKGWDDKNCYDYIIEQLYVDAYDLQFAHVDIEVAKRKLINIANRAMMPWYQLEHK